MCFWTQRTGAKLRPSSLASDSSLGSRANRFARSQLQMATCATLSFFLLRARFNNSTLSLSLSNSICSNSIRFNSIRFRPGLALRCLAAGEFVRKEAPLFSHMTPLWPAPILCSSFALFVKSQLKLVAASALSAPRNRNKLEPSWL